MNKEEYKKQRNKYDIHTTVIPIAIAVLVGIPLIFIDVNQNIIMAVVFAPIIYSYLYKALHKEPKPTATTIEEITQQPEHKMPIGGEKITIMPNHERNEKFQRIGLWIVWAIIGLPLGLVAVGLIVEYLARLQEEPFEMQDLFFVGTVVAIGIFLNWLTYKLITDSKKEAEIYQKSPFKGVEFSSKGICVDIMAETGLAKAWMRKKKLPYIEIEWGDIECITFIPSIERGEGSDPAAFRIMLNTTPSVKIGELKKYLSKYDKNIWILRHHLKGHEKQIAAIANNFTKVIIEDTLS